MMQTAKQPTFEPETPELSTWLQAVHRHLEVRKVERNYTPRPKRNRERERARREARQLFRDYYAELAVAGALN